MNTEENDELWELLGRAKAPVISPFFARNVLRTLREGSQVRLGFVFWLFNHWRIASAGTCALVIAATFAVVQHESRQANSVVLLAQQVSASPDYQVIKNLDELLDSERNSVWLEASAR